mmetsp:Transcript_27273/g.47063  ORF Transcript_27273/g.47063 Transcript_27273/m.47063 type:complete len:212 (+) Transcript_27273:135-770(+)
MHPVPLCPSGCPPRPTVLAVRAPARQASDSQAPHTIPGQMPLFLVFNNPRVPAKDLPVLCRGLHRWHGPNLRLHHCRGPPLLHRHDNAHLRVWRRPDAARPVPHIHRPALVLCPPRRMYCHSVSNRSDGCLGRLLRRACHRVRLVVRDHPHLPTPPLPRLVLQQRHWLFLPNHVAGLSLRPVPPNQSPIKEPPSPKQRRPRPAQSTAAHVT